jgi:dolichol-phosphate mannosyltransferase
MSETLTQKLARLQGPVLVLGANGFVGANLFRRLLEARSDVVGTTTRRNAWRLDGLPPATVVATDLLVGENLRRLLETFRPRTVFNLTAYGAYSFERDAPLIYRTNLELVVALTERLRGQNLAALVQAGSSSEYGDLADSPREDGPRLPNSHYSVSKAAAGDLLGYLGRKQGFPGINLRLYSIYGPWEDPSRLMPTLVMKGLEGSYPPFVDPDISRDFLYVDDACEAFADAALGMKPDLYGSSYNIGTGVRTSIAALAGLARDFYGLGADPAFATMPNRDWDLKGWACDPAKARQELGWTPRTPLRQGLELTTAWIRALPDLADYAKRSKKAVVDETHSVSAVVACYKDGQAIPQMHARLKATFEKLGVDHEIIFVNDGSPDDSEEVIRAISERDPSVLGITHSRNFGSQAAFRSGMRAASKNSVVLMDGDLQDPPELIEQMMEKWRQGYDVVYGVRVKRDATLFMRFSAKLFYRIFDRFSYIPIPRDAGDFSLMDRKVVKALLGFPERDLFVRGLRAFAGFKQVGVDYHRPERAFGRSTNNFWRNVGWAKKGILSFSNSPLEMLSFGGWALMGMGLLLAGYQVVFRLFAPSGTPRGVTTTLLLIIFFGSVNLLAVSLLGEYIAKILEEVKQRPHYIRSHMIQDGEIRDAGEAS